MEYMMNNDSHFRYSDWETFERKRYEANEAKIRRERAKRAEYYHRQRILGFVLLLIGMIALGIASLKSFRVMQGIAAMVAIAGVYIVVTKQMVLVDEYYMECMDKLNLR